MFRRTVPAAGTLAAALTVLAGCGFVHASDVSHTKPDAFVLRGRVTVAVAAGATPAVGSTCTSALPGIATGALVRISDPAGHRLGVGELEPGVVASADTGRTCDFAFAVPNVAGGVDSYQVAVADRPARSFPSRPLREDEPAVIALTS